VFRAFSRPQYRQLKGATDLPYPDEMFDIVVASGVLEHTAMDQEALKGVYRILKPHGLLALSYLPYRKSLTEWRQRRRGEGHRRLYDWNETATLLKRHGFYSIDLRFQTFVPDIVGGARRTLFHRLHAAVRYPWFTHNALCCAARKVIVM